MLVYVVTAADAVYTGDRPAALKTGKGKSKAKKTVYDPTVI